MKYSNFIPITIRPNRNNLCQIAEYHSAAADHSFMDETIVYIDLTDKVIYKMWSTTEGKGQTRWYKAVLPED